MSPTYLQCDENTQDRHMSCTAAAMQHPDLCMDLMEYDLSFGTVIESMLYSMIDCDVMTLQHTHTWFVGT